MSRVLEAGTDIGGYRIRSLLGEGGMGNVYLAEGSDGRVCALKVLSERASDDPDAGARFKREAEYAAALAHPNIVELYEAGQTAEGTAFFAMRYVDGPDLGALIAREGALNPARALAILGQIGDALDAAHAKGLVHRDVKPGNILVEERAGEPYAYLTDFGLSKNPNEDSLALTRQGQLIGTLLYTAPEEILAEPRDHVVDIYSLGCVLYEALVGAAPFVRERDIDVLYAHIGDPRPSATAARPDLPAGIDEVIAKAMAIAPADRYRSCAEFIEAARAIVPAAAPTEPTAPLAAESPPPATSPPAPSDALRLVVKTGFGVGGEVVVEDEEVVLGRLSTLDGALAPDIEISRRHATVRRTADGEFVIQDEGSANGTFVNDTLIEAPHTLSSNDEVRVGSTVFVSMLRAALTEQHPVVEPSEPTEETATAEEPAAGEPAVEAPAAESSVEQPPEIVVEAPETAPGSRVSVRLELDLEGGELIVAIENGPTARIVRDGEEWRVESP